LYNVLVSAQAVVDEYSEIMHNQKFTLCKVPSPIIHAQSKAAT